MSKIKLTKMEKNLLLGILKGKRADLKARLEWMMDDYDELNKITPITDALKEQIEIIENIIPKVEKHLSELQKEEQNEIKLINL